MSVEDDLERRELEEDAEVEEDETLEDDDVRPDGRSDAKDPWHGLNDFEE